MRFLAAGELPVAFAWPGLPFALPLERCGGLEDTSQATRDLSSEATHEDDGCS